MAVDGFRRPGAGVFIVKHAVYWPEALVMIAGSALGGYFGAYFAAKTRPENVRVIVIVIGFNDGIFLRPADLALEKSVYAVPGGVRLQAYKSGHGWNCGFSR